MRKILAIALIEVRNAIRSRVVLILLAFLLLGIAGLPMTVKGDGTAAGFVQVVLNYTLGAAGLLLSMSTLWAGCAGVSLEIEERQIHLIVTKPVTGLQLWLGKWAGLMIINAALLILAGSATYLLLMHTLNGATFSMGEKESLSREILLARDQVWPEPADVSALVDEEMQRAEQQGSIPKDQSREDFRKSVERSLLTQDCTVAPGQQHAWDIRLDHPLTPDQSVLVKYKFSASQIGPV
ncbi:MAG: ABC transporter permease subunit, partial [Lentisphaerota bacterium]